MSNKNIFLFLVIVFSLFLSFSTVFAGVEDFPDESDTQAEGSLQIISAPENIYRPTLRPTLSLQPQQTPVPRKDPKAEKIKRYYRDYYFVIEESLRVLEYNAEDYNHAVCSGDRSQMKRLREMLNIAVYGADILMDKLGLYNDLQMWQIYNKYIQNAQCGLDRGLIAETKGAMDRLHKQTERLGLWVPSTGQSEFMMNKANCAQGLFTAPNGVCLSEKGISSTKFYHSNGYAVECVWPGSCDRVGIRQMNRCDWVDCR